MVSELGRLNSRLANLDGPRLSGERPSRVRVDLMNHIMRQIEALKSGAPAVPDDPIYEARFARERKRELKKARQAKAKTERLHRLGLAPKPRPRRR